MMKKVCMIGLRHAALDCRMYYKESKTLLKAGYDVHLLCRLRYGAFTDMGGRPVGYPDANGEWKYDGMTFHGIPKRKGLLGKWLEYKDLVKVGLSLKADVYHCHGSDVSLAASVKIKKKLATKTKFIFDSAEFWAGIFAYKVSRRFYSLAYLIITQIEKRMLNCCDSLIASDLPTAGVLQVYNLTRRVSIIYNSPIIHFYNENKYNIPIHSGLKKNKTILCHEGSLNYTRKLDVCVEIIEALKDRCILYIIGGTKGADALLLPRIKKLKEEGCIVDIGWVQYEAIYNALKPANIGLSLLLNHPNYVTATPNKVFNYMALGIPIVADNYPGLRDIIERYRCGVLVNTENIQDYIDAINYLIDHPSEAKAMGQRGKEAILNELSWERQGEKLLKIYEELLNKKPFAVF